MHMENKKKAKKRKLFPGRVFLSMFCAAACLLAGCQNNQEAVENQLAFRQVGINKMNEGKFDEAAEAFQKALDQSQAVIGELELDICYYKATAQYNGGDTKGAITTCDALIDYDDKDAKAYFIRGCINLKEGDSENARKDYASALELSGNNYALYLSVYENLSGAGFEEEAEELVTKALDLEGESAEDYRERGHIYLIREEYDKARKELDQAIKMGDTKALLYLAQVYDAQGDSKKATSLYESYIKKNDADADTMIALGEVQMEAGKYQSALELFQQALEAGSPENEKNLRRNEIICYENIHDFAKAKEKIASYVKDYPEDEEAQREQQFLQTR